MYRLYWTLQCAAWDVPCNVHSWQWQNGVKRHAQWQKEKELKASVQMEKILKSSCIYDVVSVNLEPKQ